MIEIGAVASESTNLTLRSIDALAAADRSYAGMAQKEAAETESASMGFDDFLDMINPLEHIPVLSSLYRAVTGETINPVARIAGDALYSAALGPVSAGLAAIGAIGDEIVTASNGGESIAQTVVAALWEGGEDNATRLVQTETPALVMASAGGIPMAPVGAAAATTAAEETAPLSNGKAFALNKSKLPFGGVIDSSQLANAQQNQSLALALAGQRNALQAQKQVRNSRFAAPVQAAEKAAESTKTTQTASIADDLAKAEPETKEALQTLLQELHAMKAINQYKSAAKAGPIPGSAVSMTN